MPTTFSVDAEFTGDDKIVLTVFRSTDPGPMLAFSEQLTIELDEVHATMLIGQMLLAIEQFRRDAIPARFPATSPELVR